ncbi:MAG: hypothetical protein ACREH4_13120 [Vitreimonas sp.]
MNAAIVLSPVVVPALLGAWWVLATPVSGRAMAVTGWLAIGTFSAMLLGALALWFSPWFQRNAVLITRDQAEVNAIARLFAAAWITLVVLLCFGAGGWIAAGVRKRSAVAVVSAFAGLVAIPLFLLGATMPFACFFAGMCL